MWRQPVAAFPRHLHETEFVNKFTRLAPYLRIFGAGPALQKFATTTRNNDTQQLAVRCNNMQQYAATYSIGLEASRTCGSWDWQ